MAWFQHQRNESVDLAFSSIWKLSSPFKEQSETESPYVSISNVADCAAEGSADQEGEVAHSNLAACDNNSIRHSFRQEDGHLEASLKRIEWMFCALCIPHATRPGMASWCIFLILGLVYPFLTETCLLIANVASESIHHVNHMSIASEVGLLVISYLFLTSAMQSHGLPGLLQVGSVEKESDSVKIHYKKEIMKAPVHLLGIIIPCIALKVVHASILYHQGDLFAPWSQTTDFSVASASVIILAKALAWTYRTSVYLLVCIIFRLMCSLQTARVQAYVEVFGDSADESQIVKGHMTLRDQMAAISHQFRGFLLCSLLIICCSQASALYSLLVMKPVQGLSLSAAILLTSFVQVTGAGLCIHGAAQITHRTQRIVSIVSQWHAVATCGHYVPFSAHSQPSSPRSAYWPLLVNPRTAGIIEEDATLKSFGTGGTRGRPRGTSHATRGGRHFTRHGTAHILKRASSDVATFVDIDAIEHDPRNFEADAFNKRQAIVTYLSHSPCGITIYGFSLDRGFLYATFGFIFSIGLFVISRAIASW